jgi:iron(III) transport system permease protein
LLPETLPVDRRGDTSHLRRRSRGRFASRGGAWVIGLSVLVSLLALLPIAFVIGVAGRPAGPPSKPLVFRPRVGELLVNTVLLVLITFRCALRWG